YHQFDQTGLDGACGEILDHMGDVVAELAARTPAAKHSGIWVGSEGVVTPLHYDAWPGLLFQTEGTKQVSMFTPADAANLYLASPFDATGPWSDLPPRSREADPARFPRLRRARRYEATLKAGDTLFVPPFWAHEMQALEPNISVPLRFAIETRHQLHPHFLRPAWEQLHNPYLVRAGLGRSEQ
ncbi:MAG: cupin-like domain-containing protein, partial [Acidimicrobiia bacterium]|nr:cupin-like domain-containing protein [Acidimicrobiia bacterium]